MLYSKATISSMKSSVYQFSFLKLILGVNNFRGGVKFHKSSKDEN